MIDILPAARLTRAFGSELSYSDALSNVNKFNSRLLRERRMRLRLPFVDSQTHIIQTPTQTYLWRHATHRLVPTRSDQVATYPRKPWRKRRPNPPPPPPPPPSTAQSQPTNTSNGTEQQADALVKANSTNEPMEDDPRVAVRAGELGMSESDLQTISTIENPVMGNGRHTGGSSDDSSQSSAAPMTGLVQPQQPHWPQHNTTTHSHHLQNYILDGDDDLDDLDFDDYSGPGTPGGPASPAASSSSRSKRTASQKRNSQTSAKKTTNGGTSAGSAAGGANSSTPIHPGHRRNQYTLAELPYVCEFCSARYKTKPGLQYHLAKHKDTNSDNRPSSVSMSHTDNGGSSSPTSANMKSKYMDSQQQQHPMYPMASGPGMPNNVPGHLPPNGSGPGMPSGPYPMNHPQAPYGVPPHSMPPSASMPLTVAALSGSAPTNTMPYYSHQQQQQMAHQQHMMMMQQQQASRAPMPPSEPPGAVTPGLQCDFCGGDEQENKTTKLPEQMITCKDCGGSAHPTCLKFTPNMVRQVKTYPWQCMECKTCTECGNSENDSELLFCDDCDRGYHMYCCSPPLLKAPEGDWRCKLCCSQFGELKS